MYTAKCLYFIYDHLHCLCKKWSSLKIWLDCAVYIHVHLYMYLYVISHFFSSEINSVSEWVWQFYDDLVGHMTKYHTHLCTFSILQDTKSQDWTNNKPFFEVKNMCMYTARHSIYIIHTVAIWVSFIRVEESPFIFKCGGCICLV